MAKFYYNDVLLPEIPSDVLAEYPYCWFRLDSDGVTYDLICGKYIWYYNSPNLYTTSSKYVWYTANSSSDIWSYKTSYTDNGSFGLDNGLKWSNHNIPNGSATATDIYFYGSEPIPEFPEVEPYYQIKGDTLTSFADQARRISGEEGTLTTAQMLEIFEGVDFTELAMLIGGDA